MLIFQCALNNKHVHILKPHYVYMNLGMNLSFILSYQEKSRKTDVSEVVYIFNLHI